MAKKTEKKDDEVVKLVISHLERIEKKVDKLDERLDAHEKVAIKQEANLELHMKRSDLLELSQDDLKKAVEPILKVYTIAWGITKLIGGLGLVIGILGGVLKLFGKV